MRYKPTELNKDALKLVYVELFPAADFPAEDIDAFFVLSTGRCGTATLDRILSLSPNVASFHEPMPRLHEYHIKALHEPSPFFDNLVKQCRIDLMSAVMSMGHKYAECQHRWTAYAPSIKRVFPKTKFIYLRRDMDEFVSSALQWHFYDVGKRYAPPEIRNDEGKMLAWHWCKTNEFIIDFVKTLPNEDWMFLDFESIRGHEWERFFEIYDWMEVERPTIGDMELVLNNELNRGRRQKIEKGWGDFNERSKTICIN